ncbi:hypothetical protein BJ875DRAFT_484329 [Amylocarpus encephaloides]|uniref:Uncharacterized protein n=1 Tax=Amylocarpus encephaloides TaxID=45428 RepID=A0A9P7YJL5_9HELO|nr:hypothetical protein BJ875DRAFT_484329 [Amylocarpus encephaloides]
MSSSKPKKVHYSSTTKSGGKSDSRSHHRHSHKDSRDSGVGSSSASDRASLGTSPNQPPFNPQEIHNQRHNHNALNEALDAANERIQELLDQNALLEASLKDSNRENRALRKERSALEDAVDALAEDQRQTKRHSGSSSRPPVASSSISTANSSAPRHAATRRPSSSSSSSSTCRPGPPPSVPQATDHMPNPFTPLSERPQVTYAPSVGTSVAYSMTPANVQYAPTPVFTHQTVAQTRPREKRGATQERMYPNDGNYHAYPV